MTSPDAAQAGEPLQFDTAVLPGEATAPVCTQCSTAIADHYFEANGAVVCERCKASIESTQKDGSGSRSGRLGRATLYGLVAAVIGALFYYGVREVTGYEIGLISIVVGFLVGRAVQMGSRGRGGWRYQTLAVGLTYLAIGSTYVPMFVAALPESTIALPVFAALAIAAPIVANLGQMPQGLIGIAIVVFALMQAWNMNRRVTLAFTGPYKVGVVPPDGRLAPQPAA